MTSDAPGSAAAAMQIVYDGDCPFCRNYVSFLRLRDGAGPVSLTDARTAPELVARLSGLGYDLDDGMVLIIGDEIYHGDACLHRLALMSTRSGMFNRVNALMFRSPTVSRLVYPVLRAGRNLVLRILGRRKISETTQKA